MANANANLMSLANMSKATNSTTRPQNSLRANRANSDAKNSKSNVNFSSSRSQKNNFGSELDKANAQINQSQQQPEEVQAVAENVESEPVNELAKAPTHGKSKHKQDAPNQQNLPKNENPQPIAENVAAENIVAERISPTIPAQIPTTIDVEEPEIISQNVEVEIVSAPQDTPKFSKEIPLNPFNNVSEKVAKNSTPTIPVNLRDEVIDVAETPTLASSADMAFYFASTTENLLAVKDTPVATEKNNLMSIMPQTHDDKAQSMLNLLLIANGVPCYKGNRGGSILDTPETAKDSNPINHIGKNTPPFLIMHGNADTTVSPSQSKIFYDALIKNGVDVDYYVVNGGEHNAAHFYQPKTFGIIIDFLNRVLR